MKNYTILQEQIKKLVSQAIEDAPWVITNDWGITKINKNGATFNGNPKMGYIS